MKRIVSNVVEKERVEGKGGEDEDKDGKESKGREDERSLLARKIAR